MPPSSFILLLFARGMASRKGNIPFANKRKACPKGTKAIHAQERRYPSCVSPNGRCPEGAAPLRSSLGREDLGGFDISWEVASENRGSKGSPL